MIILTCYYVIVIYVIKFDLFFGIRLFQQRIAAAIMPPVAFVAVPRLPPPTLESLLSLPDSRTWQTTKFTLRYSDSDDEDAGSLQDYCQQTITSSTGLLQHSNTEHNEQPM